MLKRRKRSLQESSEPFGIEPMEPRILLSADALGIDAGIVDPEVDDSAAWDMDVATDWVQVLGDDGPSPLPEPEPGDTAPRSEIVFLDAGVDNGEQLLADLTADGGRHITETHIIDADTDGVAQIARLLAGQNQPVDAIHILSHGAAGQIQLGNTTLSTGSLDGYAGELNDWGSAFSDEADILIYGCDLAADDQGKALVDAIGVMTGADVAASVDPTGHAALGGDWDLEFQAGKVETTVFSPGEFQTWHGTLATFVVDTTDDTTDANPGDGVAEDASGHTSLRAAIMEANRSNEPDTIFLSSGIYQLTLTGGGTDELHGDLDVNDPVHIVGSGASSTIIDANSIDRIFEFGSDADGSSIAGVTLRNGDPGNADGGAIWTQRPLTIIDTELTGNTAKNGGAIVANATLTLERVSIIDNEAINGGGVTLNAGDGHRLTNVTISGNTTSTGSGGGLDIKGATTLNNVTIANNTANANGGGINTDGSAVTVTNSLIADNTANISGNDVFGSFTSDGSNLVEDVSGSTGFGGTDIIGTDPNLDPLAYDGGEIRVLALGAGSVAIDKGDVSTAAIVDARGFLRGDGNPDIGAYEAGATASTTLAVVQVAAPVTEITPEDTALVFSVGNGNAVTVSDDTASDTLLRATLTVNNGILDLASTVGLTSLLGDGTSTVVVVGTESAINTALDGLTFTPTPGYNGPVNLQVTADLSADLAGLYEFEINGDLGDDTSPNGTNDGAVVGATQIIDGSRGNVLHLDGSDVVTVPGIFGEPQSLTLAAWVQLDAAAGGAEVISLGNRVILRLDETVSGLGVFGSYHDGSGYRVTSSNTFVAGTGWHHVAYTLDGTTNEQVLYIDGIAVETTNHAGAVVYTGGNTALGRHATSGSYFFEGEMDDARIYERVLGSKEIEALANDASSATVSVAITVNAAPTLTTFAAAVTLGDEDTEIKLTFGQLEAQGDEADADGTVDGFVVKSVTSGVLTIGADAATATPWIAGSNDTLNASTNAFWTPDPDANGTLDAFEVVALDDSGAESAVPVAVQVTVNAVNDAPTVAGPAPVLINEIHYDNIGVDTGEAIEIAGVAGNDLNGWSLVLYSGAGGTVYDTVALFGVLPNEVDNFGTLVFNFPENGIQNATSGNPDGMALVDPAGNVVQFLSYEGTFTATEGPAIGMTSTDIGVLEDGADAIGQSLQLNGAGATLVWTGPAMSTFGSINAAQDFGVFSAATSQAITEEASLVFSPGNGNAIVVGDVDAAEGAVADPIQVKLDVVHGTLTLGSTTGLGSVSGNGTQAVIFTGSVAAVNTAMDGLTYAPDLDFFGGDTLSILVDDQANTGSGGAQIATGVVQIRVDPVNDAPTVSGTYAMAGTDENTTSVAVQVGTVLGGPGVTSNDDDGDTLGIAVFAKTGNGTWEYSTNGTSGWTAFGTVDPLASLLLSESTWVRYVPDGENGETADFDFRAWDQTVGTASSNGSPSYSAVVSLGGDTPYSNGVASVSLLVASANDPPTATHLSTTVTYNEGASSIGLEDIVIDDVDSGEIVTATLQLSAVAAGALSATDGAAYDPGTGTWTITGTVSSVNTALANLEFNSAPDHDTDSVIDITIDDDDEDGSGPLTGTITLDVTPTNDAPTVTPSGTVTYTENAAPIIINAGITVDDIDSATLSGATVRIVGNYSSDQDVLAFAGQPGISGSWDAATGTLTLSGIASVADYQNALSTVTYENTSEAPDIAFRTIEYVVDDGADSSTPVTSYVTVVAWDDPPALTTNTLTISQGQTVTLDSSMLAADDLDDPNDDILFSVSAVTHGRFALSSDPATPITSFLQSAVTAGDIVFVHDGGEVAPTYQVAAASGGQTDGPDAATVLFGNVNAAPAIEDATLPAVDEDTPNPPGETILNLFGPGFADPDPGSSFEGVAVIADASVPSEGVWQYSTDGTHWFAIGSVGDDATALVLSTAAEVRFLPAHDYHGNSGSLMVRGIDDSYIGGFSDTTGGIEARVMVNAGVNGGSTPLSGFAATLSTAVNPVDDVPTITGDINGGVTEDDAATLTVSGDLDATGGDAGEDLFTAETLTGTYGDLVVSASGGWTYTANNSQAAIQALGPTDSLTDSFTVTNADGVTTATVTISIDGTDDVPTISGDIGGGVTEDAAATLTVSGDLDTTGGDAGEDLFTAETLTGTYGDLVVSASGGWTYTANNSQAAIQALGPTDSLTDSFTVTNADGVTTQTVTIAIDGVNDAPGATPVDLGSISEEAGRLITQSDLLAGSSDTEGDTLTAIALSVTSGSGTLTDNLDGTWTFVPTANWNGAVGFTFTVYDGTDATANTATLTVDPVNDAPTLAIPISDQSATEETPFTFQVAAGTFDDADTGDSLSYTAERADGSALPAWLTFDPATRTFTGTPDDLEVGGFDIRVTATDGAGATASDTFRLVVSPVNDAPAFGRNTLTLDPGEIVVLTPAMLSATDVDHADGGLLFTVGGISGGQFELVGAPGFAIFSFTQAQLTAGDVVFVDDGDNVLPAYQVSVSDGAEVTGPAPAKVAFKPAPLLVDPPSMTPEPTESVAPKPAVEPEPEPEEEPDEPVAEDKPVVDEAQVEPIVADEPDVGPFATDDTLTVTFEGELPTVASSVATTGNTIKGLLQGLFVRPIEFDAPTSAFESHGFAVDPTAAAIRAVLTSDGFNDRIDRMREDIEEATVFTDTVVGSSVAVTTGLSVGYVAWLVRGGVLLSTALSSLPAWQFVDPLPVLARTNEGKDGDGADDSLESIIEEQSRRDERNVERNRVKPERPVTAVPESLPE